MRISILAFARHLCRTKVCVIYFCSSLMSHESLRYVLVHTPLLSFAEGAISDLAIRVS
jgi:hypothetical protein